MIRSSSRPLLRSTPRYGSLFFDDVRWEFYDVEPFAWLMQVVSQNANLLAPIAVDAVLKVIDPKTATNVDLNDIKVRTVTRIVIL